MKRYIINNKINAPTEIVELLFPRCLKHLEFSSKEATRITISFYDSKITEEGYNEVFVYMKDDKNKDSIISFLVSGWIGGRI